MAQAITPRHELNSEIEQLVEAAKNGTEEKVLKLLREFVPNYHAE